MAYASTDEIKKITIKICIFEDFEEGSHELFESNNIPLLV
jgi:hypothetical protein